MNKLNGNKKKRKRNCIKHFRSKTLDKQVIYIVLFCTKMLFLFSLHLIMLDQKVKRIIIWVDIQS